jgi:tetratricopeptide (TPR) repeat protein
LADHVPDPAELATTVGRFVRLQLVQDQQCESVRRTARTPEAAVAYCAVLAEFFRYTQVGDFDLHLAMDRAQRAVALDPDIADAHFFVGWSYVWLAETGQLDWRDAARQARASLGRGLTLVPNDAQLLALRGRIEALELDYQAADASFRASLAGDPLHPRAHLSHGRLGNLALAQGHISEALGHFGRSLRIYDANAAQYMNYGAGLLFAGQNREAIGAVDSGLRLVERGGTRLYLLAIRALAYDALGEAAEANAALDEALASVGPGLKPQLAFLLARLGRFDEARALLAQLEAMETPPVEPMVRAYVELDRDRAFEWIHIAIDRHVTFLVVGLRTSITYAELRKDPRWAEVMAHLEAEEAKGRGRGRGSE